MATSTRGRWLTTAAVLFGILAISNAAKGLQLDDQTGFVLLGQRLTGTPNAVFGLIFAVFLAAYAYGIWNMRKFALPMAWVYAAYVVTNLVLFPFRTPPRADAGSGYQVFVIVYAIVAIGVSAGTAWVLTKRRNDLV